MKYDTVKSLVLLAAAGFIGWKVYQANKLAGEVVESVSDTASGINQARLDLGASIGGGLYNVFNK